MSAEKKQTRNRGKDLSTIIENEDKWNALKSQFHSDKNEREFDTYGPYSNKKVWWKCAAFGHEWEALICNRYKSNTNGNGCPYCSGRKTCDDTSLFAKNPEVAKEWHPEKNILSSNEVSPNSNKKVWWKCTASCHEWEATINSRSKGTGCPHCRGNTTADGNTLLNKFPEVAKEWHPTKNECTPSEITPGSDKKVWWICPINKSHEYETKLSNRTKHSTGCPYCVGKKVKTDNSFESNNPEMVKEWHLTKNDKSPNEYSRSSGKSVWWQCSEKHEWQASISNRLKGHGCPYCSGRKPSAERNLATSHLELIKEWSSKNEKKPEDYTTSSHSKVWWICSKNPLHEWKAKIANRSGSTKTNCPRCNMSKLELATCNYLEKSKIEYESEYIFSNLKQYRYDFYIPSLKTLIECDGIQHFENHSKFYESKTRGKNFQEQQESDIIKTKYANNNGYKIIRIAHTELNKVEDILNSAFQLNKNIQFYPEELYKWMAL
jgi:very-short-patch-repair endonuclease